MNFLKHSTLLLLTLLVFLATGFGVYAQPQTTMPSGEELFIENRCVRCHTIGRGKFVGPDLAGVAERYPKEEIIKWIMDPQYIYKLKGKMPLNEGYPPMPPLKVTPESARSIAQYLITATPSKTDSPGGTIKGKIENRSSNEAAVDTEIVLTSFMGDKPTDETSMKSDAEGNYEFRDLPWDRSYMITVNYRGAQYSTDKMVFNPGENEKSLDLPIFEPTSDDKNILVTESHLILQVIEGVLSVADLSVFLNPSKEIYIGNKDLGEGKRETLRFDTPEKALNVNFIHGISKEDIVQTKDGFSDTVSVMPGPKRSVFAYNLSLNEGDVDLNKVILYPTESFVLLISYTEEDIKVTGLKGGDIVDMQGEKFIKWTGTNLKPGERIIIKYPSPFATGDNTKWLSLGVFLAILLAGIVYSSFKYTFEGAAEPLGTTKEDLALQRDRLIKEIAQLDDSYEVSKISKNDYDSIRKVKKEKVILLTRRLRFM